MTEEEVGMTRRGAAHPLLPANVVDLMRDRAFALPVNRKFIAIPFADVVCLLMEEMGATTQIAAMSDNLRFCMST